MEGPLLKICCIIPVHNEARQIGPVVEQIRRRQYDVVVVDDGSTDGSGDIALTAGAHVVGNEGKHGKGFSLKKGFEYALAKGYDGVITIDGDGQHDVDDIPAFLEAAARQPSCIVTGNRMSDPKGMPWLRLLTNRIMSFLISRLCRQNIPDTQCGYRYIACDILRRLPLTSNDYEIETEVLIKASKIGYSVISVPVRSIYRDEESKIHPLRDTIRFFRYLVRESCGK